MVAERVELCAGGIQLGGNFTYITHKDDPVPLVPPQFLGYVHPSGEVHIVSTDDASGNATQTVACPGRENENCQDGNSLLKSSVSDHLGESIFGSCSFMARA